MSVLLPTVPPPLPLLLQPSVSVLYICVSVPSWKQAYLHHFSRFHIHALRRPLSLVVQRNDSPVPHFSHHPSLTLPTPEHFAHISYLWFISLQVCSFWHLSYAVDISASLYLAFCELCLQRLFSLACLLQPAFSFTCLLTPISSSPYFIVIIQMLKIFSDLCPPPHFFHQSSIRLEPCYTKQHLPSFTSLMIY